MDNKDTIIKNRNQDGFQSIKARPVTLKDNYKFFNKFSFFWKEKTFRF